MSSEQIIKNISSLLSRIYVEIELLSHSGLLDRNIFAENLMLQLFNNAWLPSCSKKNAVLAKIGLLHIELRCKMITVRKKDVYLPQKLKNTE